MNATPQDRPTPDEYAELARLLPAPGDPDLSSDRHRLLREHLMDEIRTDPPVRRRRRLVWTLAPVAAAAVAAIVVVGVTAAGTPDPAHHRAAPAGPGVPGLTGDETAPELLGKVALASAAGHTVPARADQYVYVRSTVAFASYAEGGKSGARLDRPHQRQVWLSVDGRHPGRLSERGEDTTLGPVPAPSVHAPTYAYLKTLPTEPDRLLARIHADHDAKPSGPGRDAEAFVAIGDLLRESLVPPKLAAGLYRAAARIPGVTVVRTATDAAGRTGVAVAMADRKAGSRTEWIFDRGTLEFLGERTVQVAPGDTFPPGTVIGSSAVTDRAVVDTPGQLPR